MSKQAGGPRRNRSRKEADQLAAEYEASGLTQQAFGKLKGIALKTLSRYVVRHRRDACNVGGPGRLVAVKVKEQNRSGGELTLVLAAGQRIEVRPGFDGETLQRLLAVVERS